MKLLRAIFFRLAAEMRAQYIGRRSLREIRFEKYKVARKATDRVVAERLLRQLGNSLEASSLA